MSKYTLGDFDYQIPGSGRDALEWELSRSGEELDCLKAEIARLKEDLWTAKQDITDLAIRRSRLEDLCTRAADALQYATEEPKVWCNFNKLIAELRKAAE